MLNQNEQEIKKPKKMLQLRKEGQKYYVEINFSSLDLLQTCMRKSYYVLDQLLVSNSESEALSFGSAIHKALEHWYCLPKELRELKPSERELAQLIGYGSHSTSEANALGSIQQFYNSAKAGLSSLPETDKRSIQSGIKILSAYFKHYANDELEVVQDVSGKQLTEKEFSFVLYDSPELRIDFFGTIDVILRNTQTNLLMVTDHKTTHALGTEFYQRCKPNYQYCGYVMAAQRCLGINTSLFLVNGIQVAKTKTEFARQVVEYNEEDFAELTNAIIFRVRNYIACKETGIWPMTSPGPCSNYGGCQFLRVCEVPNSIKQNVLNASFKIKEKPNGTENSCN